MKLINTMMSVLILTGLSTSCTPKKKAASAAFSTNISGKQVKNELRDPAALMKFMKDNNYYASALLQAGAKVYYSTSYGTGDKSSSSNEAGQAHGELRQSAGGLFFHQADNTTTQALLPPGASSQFGQGMSRWKFDGKDGFGQLLLDVATNQRARNKGALHTGYNQMEVALVSFSGGTAGGQVAYQDVIEVSLGGGESRTEIYFAKGLGPVAMEFQENYMPGGTAKVYFENSGARIPAQSAGLH